MMPIFTEIRKYIYFFIRVKKFKRNCHVESNNFQIFQIH